ncbi:hypothetical protein KSP39_PZI010878 [Platanthera zijinensis]|uniref:PPIase cyclophilin-type domain-containing protein n=1 Tax=Platanthera zijinensis TaxID=2320716 RepID=A0AAP0BHN3_9ASPA
MAGGSHGRRQPWPAAAMAGRGHGRPRPWPASAMAGRGHGRPRPWPASAMAGRGHGRPLPWPRPWPRPWPAAAMTGRGHDRPRPGPAAAMAGRCRVRPPPRRRHRPGGPTSGWPPRRRAFFARTFGGALVGRFIRILFIDNMETPAGVSQKFKSVSGTQYRVVFFVKKLQTNVQFGVTYTYHAGMIHKWLFAVQNLVSEFTERKGCEGTRIVRGTVGIVVRNPSRKQPSTKIVARKGRIEMEEEEGEAGPNGSEFVIATKDSPDLDAAALVVGRVIDGMDVVESIAGVSAVKDNTGSPYFRVAKLIGDKRAVVAERGFNRPYVKVVITDCGLLMD